MTHQPYRAVFFDLDGTLFDTAEDLVPTIRDTVATLGIQPASVSQIRASIALGSRGMLATALNSDINDVRIERLMPEFYQRYEQATGEKSDYFVGMEAVLMMLEQQQIPWGIITNKNTRFARAIVRRKNLEHRISVLVCGDTLPQVKPHPAPLRYACAQLNIHPEQALFVGDSPVDIQAARAANMPCVAVAWGYTPENENPSEWGASYTFSHPQELHDMLWKKLS